MRSSRSSAFSALRLPSRNARMVRLMCSRQSWRNIASGRGSLVAANAESSLIAWSNCETSMLMHIKPMRLPLASRSAAVMDLSRAPSGLALSYGPYTSRSRCSSISSPSSDSSPALRCEKAFQMSTMRSLRRSWITTSACGWSRAAIAWATGRWAAKMSFMAPFARDLDDLSTQTNCHHLALLDSFVEIIFSENMFDENKRRPYRLKQRAETADETRRRLVQATFELHMEQGIA